MENKKINNLRAELDEIDDKIVELLDQRVLKAVMVGEVKASAGMTQVYVPEREAAILKRFADKPLKRISMQELEKIYQEIFSVCRKVQISDKLPISEKTSN